jgi:hypothetical protein
MGKVGDLVWAKVAGWPWWPAAVVTAQAVPASKVSLLMKFLVLSLFLIAPSEQRKDVLGSKGHGCNVLVIFFGGKCIKSTSID